MNDLDLVAEVDTDLRGSRAEDVEFLLTNGASLEVIDRRGCRGYAVHGRNRLVMLGVTHDEVAAQLLWRVLAAVGPSCEIWGSPPPRTGP